MELAHISKNPEMHTDQKSKKKHNYIKPTLFKVGTVVELTAGAIGSVPDVTSPGTMPHA